MTAESPPTPSSLWTSPTPLKVASYNVNGVNGRLARLLEWLESASPDVVCLQEIKTTDEKCPARALERAGYGSL